MNECLVKDQVEPNQSKEASWWRWLSSKVLKKGMLLDLVNLFSQFSFSPFCRLFYLLFLFLNVSYPPGLDIYTLSFDNFIFFPIFRWLIPCSQTSIHTPVIPVSWYSQPWVLALTNIMKTADSQVPCSLLAVLRDVISVIRLQRVWLLYLIGRLSLLPSWLACFDEDAMLERPTWQGTESGP